MYSGKSSIALALSEYKGYHRLSLSSSLKNVASLAYGEIDKSETYVTSRRNGTVESVSGRHVLQQIGQVIKDFDRDFFLRCLDRDVGRYDGMPMTIDDLRFMHELDWLRPQGWFIVAVSTPEYIRMHRAVAISGRRPSAQELGHESEVEIPLILSVADLIVSGDDDPYNNAAAILLAAEKWRAEK